MPLPKNRLSDKIAMRARSSESGWKARQRERKQKPMVILDTISAGSAGDKPPLCWCMEPLGHDWPGKDERAPHPRS